MTYTMVAIMMKNRTADDKVIVHLLIQRAFNIDKQLKQEQLTLFKNSIKSSLD